MYMSYESGHSATLLCSCDSLNRPSIKINAVMDEGKGRRTNLTMNK